MMPIAWTKTYQIPGGKEGRAFVINRKRELIAFHDLESLTVATSQNNKLRLAKVEE